MDCIYEEKISVEEFRLRYLNESGTPIKGFKYIQSVGVDEREMNSYKR